MDSLDNTWIDDMVCYCLIDFLQQPTYPPCFQLFLLGMWSGLKQNNKTKNKKQKNMNLLGLEVVSVL